MTLREALTFDDVCLLPARSPVCSRSDVRLDTRISRTITLKIPLISSYMDTVTEVDMAVAMAREGGIGIIHRFCSIEDEVNMVRAVKRKEDLVVKDPYFIGPDATLREFRILMREKGVHSILVLDDHGKFLGIVQYKHQLFKKDAERTVREYMAPRERLLVVNAREFMGLDQQAVFEKADAIFEEDKIIRKHIILVDENEKVEGLITFQNVKNRENPRTTRDKYGRLAVAASAGITGDYLDRVDAILKAGADLIVVNVAHGHLEKCIKAVKDIKRLYPNCDLVAGDVATCEGALDLAKAGADGIMVGVGPGSICSTRVVTGTGVPQISAIHWSWEGTRRRNRKNPIPIIGDGGLRTSGDLVKALAAGASAYIVGNILAGTKEAPGKYEYISGRKVKLHRGMASHDARRKLIRAGYGNIDEEIENDLVSKSAAEGIEAGYVADKGTVHEVISELLPGIRSGMSYCGTHSIEEIHKGKFEKKFIKVTVSGVKEGKPHDLLNVHD